MTAIPLRRGACPSLAAPMPTGDGLLVRLRPAAPALTADDLVALADLARAHGNGLVEITARGNLQLRGLTEASAPRLAEGLAAAGIVLQTGLAIEISPLSGLDPSETADATPLAAALREAVAAGPLILAPKLAVVIDGGGVLSLADMVADIRLDAVSDAAWRLSVGGDRRTARPVATLPAARVVEGAMTILKALADIGPAARGRDLDETALAARFGAAAGPALAAELSRHPLGVHRIAGEIVLGIAPAYGQVQADRLAALARSLPACEFRLAPHRTLLVRGLSEDTLPAAQACAQREGFWCTEAAPGRSVSICAGAAGCASAGFDTHAAADAVIAAAGELLDGSIAVHVSGCPKGCAHPARAAVTLCGTAAGLGLVIDGRAGDAPAAVLPAGDLKPAIQRLGALLRARRADGETARSLLDRTAHDLICADQGQS